MRRDRVALERRRLQAARLLEQGCSEAEVARICHSNIQKSIGRCEASLGRPHFLGHRVFFPLSSRRSQRCDCPIAGNLAPGASQIEEIGHPIPQLAIATVGIVPAPLIELALNAEEPSLCGPIIRVHGCFLRHHSPIGSLPAFALCTAFPCSDYYAGSVP